MLKKVLGAVGVLLLAAGLLWMGCSGVIARGAGGRAGDAPSEACPPGHTAYVVLEPVRPGEQASRVLEQGCQPVGVLEQVLLAPILPGEEGWAVESSGSGGGLQAVNGIVRGPSGETSSRCVVLLEPIQPGQQSSEASEPVCSDGPIDSVNGVSLESSYLIAQFYQGTDYGTLLVEYYGSSPCSATIGYGAPELPGSLDNTFASGQAYSDCDHIHVYDLGGFDGPCYACGANCSSFYALDGAVSSWWATD